MTEAFTQTRFSQQQARPQFPTPPTGWPIGSYDSYEKAQAAVDHLASTDFPIADVTIVGVQPMLVERIAGRMSWGKMLSSAAMSGAVFGLFLGLVLSLLNPGAGLLSIVIGLVAGVAFNLLFGALGYAANRNKRGFVSQSQLVAQRYDVLSQPRNAEKGRALLADLAARSAFGH
ncbi:general stress protein [Amycolatopsis sp. FDAARGOS 1241]|uniref:general stress protein n=1 Tax=Amycolatopsis sp. FDAARGOS 1241 TaxID=2778070 RepID=UPI0019502F05|nr:general stress protein [Amycolatopsis sp. FDAARGOS 1241]QRP44466.1 magnesium transporter [Amycolatopsis sp. FDAARGOS 1241]